MSEKITLKRRYLLKRIAANGPVEETPSDQRKWAVRNGLILGTPYRNGRWAWTITERGREMLERILGNEGERTMTDELQWEPMPMFLPKFEVWMAHDGATTYVISRDPARLQNQFILGAKLKGTEEDRLGEFSTLAEAQSSAESSRMNRPAP